MTKKDVLEIRHQFAPSVCSISKICGCYVDGDHNKVATIKEQFLTMPEEETFKYFEIFKKTLSGSIGKNLVTMPFPTSQEFEGGTQEFLCRLRKSKLEDDDLVNEFYDKVIETYDYTGNYLIMLIHDTYDIPGKTTDGILMDDASDEVYEYIMCSICHVNLSKAGLSYFDVESTFHNRVRDWVVDMPDIGFLFPAFIDRSTDVHNILYYTKKPEELHESFISNLLGTGLPITAGEQKDVFHEIVAETLGDDCNYDTVMNIHEKLNELIESQKDEPEPVVLTKSEVKRLFEDCGVEDEKLQSFDEQYEINAGEKSSLVASNITNTRRFEIKTPDVVVHVDPERAALVETKLIDGVKCLVIPMEGDVELNGIRIHTGEKSVSDEEDSLDE